MRRGDEGIDAAPLRRGYASVCGSDGPDESSRTPRVLA
jgi:hypothetical protein